MRTVVLALALFTLFAATTAVPALAQGEENVRDPAPAGDDNTLYSGPYAVTEEGTLIYGGDTLYQCEYLVRLGAPAKPGSEVPTINGTVLEPLTREAVELCAKAGFPSKGAILSASVNQSNLESGERDTLPATGGAVLPALVLGAASLVAAAILLAHGTRR